MNANVIYIKSTRSSDGINFLFDIPGTIIRVLNISRSTVNMNQKLLVTRTLILTNILLLTYEKHKVLRYITFCTSLECQNNLLPTEEVCNQPVVSVRLSFGNLAHLIGSLRSQNSVNEAGVDTVADINRLSTKMASIWAIY